MLSDKSNPRPPVVVILGPTAVGKTEAGLHLAEKLRGEIVSVDSRLLYRYMDIGTAKPSPAELARVPHHLVDSAEPDEVWSLAQFQHEARRAIHSIHARRRLPFLVGGSGQYIRAVTQEWNIPHVAPNPSLRQALENWAGQISSEGLHARLAALDPEAAAAMDPRNLRRTIRALEVIFVTGRPFSAQKQRGLSPYRILQLGLVRPRGELYARIDARIEAMIEAGIVEEVKGLLARGYSPDLPSMSAIGYREIAAYLKGKLSLEEAVAEIKRATRIFVRRQANWFKANDLEIHWFQAGPGALIHMEALIVDWMREYWGKSPTGY